MILSLSSVQTKIAESLTDKINSETGVNMRIGKVQITPTGKIILKDFIAFDEKMDTIFYGKRLQTYILNPWRITKDNQLKLGITNIDDLRGKIIYYKDEKYSNLDKYIDKLDGESTGGSGGNPFIVEAKKILITNSHFKYFDYNFDNPRILDFDHLHTDVSDFKVEGADVSLRANSIQFYEYHGLQVRNLSTEFVFDDKKMSFKDFKLDTDDSTLDMNLIFKANNGKYHDFLSKIRLEGNIEEAYISTNDLQKFTDIFASDKRFSVSTKLSGVLNNLQFTDFESITNNKVEIDGDINIINLFDDDIIIDSKLKKLNFSFAKLKALLPRIITDNIPQNLYALGNVSTVGKIKYNSNFVESDIVLNSDLGKALIKLKMNELENISKTKYSGHITTNGFKLKELIDADLDDLATDIEVRGKGLTLSSMNTYLNGNVTTLKYNDYTYQNIKINGTFKEQLFQGLFEIIDPNLEMDFSGLIDFSKAKRKLDFTTQICKADLYKLNWSKNDEISRFIGNIDMQAEGTNVDDFVGKVKVYNSIYTNHNATYSFKDFLATSTFVDNVRKIEFISDDVVEGYIKGKYKFKHISLMLQNAFGSVFANYKIKPIADDEYMNYNLKIHNKIVELLNPNIKIAENTVVKGKISSKDNKLKMRLLSSDISMGDNHLVNLNVRIDNKNPLYNIFLKLDTIKTSFYTFSNFRTLNTTINDTLYLKSKFEGGDKTKDKYNIAFYYTMDEMQNFIFGLQKSDFNFKNIDWKINPDINYNRIFYSQANDSLHISDAGILHKNERLSINGYKTANNLKFDIGLDSLDFGHILPDIPAFNFNGVIDGNINLTKLDNDILPTAVLNINNFQLNDEVLGDVNLKINTLKGKIVFMDMSINKQGLQTLRANGFVDLNKKDPLINGSLLMQEFPVTPLQELFKDMFANVRGTITGNVQIKGKANDLSYDGKLYLQGFGLKVLALNTDYQFDNRSVLYLHHQTFELKKAHFFDVKYNTKGLISGIIKHNNFEKWYLDLNIDTDNMLVLDTPTDPDELYYGKAFVGGNTRIHGYADRLIIDADMQTKSNTNFVITLSDGDVVGEDDFVRIISKKDYTDEKNSKKKNVLVYEGLEMNFDLDITPDAEVKIILDQQFGSKLIASGSGGMLLEINTNGSFNMWGDFTVLKGIYNFRYGGFIDKKFAVEPGSTISWEGDPYNANLDIKAMYETFGDPSVLLTDQAVTAKNMPVQVIIYLKEKLIHPAISFDLDFPKANAILKSQVDYVLSDTDKKTLQVMSLLSFGNFINENDYSLSKQATEGVVKTFSERGLNLLNTLMGQDENFQVNLNYSGGEYNIEKNLITDSQVGLSLTTKINKRVYINGKVAIPVGRFTKSSIVGDVELEVYLDDEGNLKFRVFNKQTELEYLGQQEGYTQGVGLSYQIDFDTFSEILSKFGIRITTDE